MAIFLNQTETIGRIITAGANNVTGDILGAILVIFIVLVAVCIYFQIPIEFMAIILLPLAITASAYLGGPFMAIVVCILILISWIIAKNWLAH